MDGAGDDAKREKASGRGGKSRSEGEREGGHSFKHHGKISAIGRRKEENEFKRNLDGRHERSKKRSPTCGEIYNVPLNSKKNKNIQEGGQGKD